MADTKKAFHEQVAEKLISEKLDDSKHQALAQQFVTDLSRKPSA